MSTYDDVIKFLINTRKTSVKFPVRVHPRDDAL